MNDDSITKKITSGDWAAFDALTDDQVHKGAQGDPDNPPLTGQDVKRMRRTPPARIIRRALGLSQEEFAARFQIPLGTLRDWEQGRTEPDQAARAYLKVIAGEPDTVRRILSP
ncbi:MAG: helix-turn-helix domain-containing protein [Geminicoccaceae bacterium]